MKHFAKVGWLCGVSVRPAAKIKVMMAHLAAGDRRSSAFSCGSFVAVH